jgi:hypothetical protein
LNAANVAGARRGKSPGASVGKRGEQTASGESAADALQGVTPGASVGKLGDEKRTRVGGHPAALASARWDEKRTRVGGHPAALATARWDDEADARRGAPLGASVGKRTLVVRMNYYDKKNRNTDYTNIHANVCAGPGGDTILCYSRNIKCSPGRTPEAAWNGTGPGSCVPRTGSPVPQGSPSSRVRRWKRRSGGERRASGEPACAVPVSSLPSPPVNEDPHVRTRLHETPSHLTHRSDHTSHRTPHL